MFKILTQINFFETEMGMWFLIVLFILFVMSLTAYILTGVWHKKTVRNSDYIHQLREINDKYVFAPIDKKEFRFMFSCKKKTEYDRFDYLKFLEVKIENNEGTFRQLVDNIELNIDMLNDYTNEYDGLESAITKEISKRDGVPYFYYKLSEKNWKERNRKKPTTDIMVIIRCSYRSPGGRTYISNVKEYNFKKVQAAYYRYLKIREEEEKYQNLVRMERNKMTSSMRYNVLKRDGFRCQICGASQEDGVTLHVDHIVPVSKGGKTEMKNLRTLCSRCNLGKSNKIE